MAASPISPFFGPCEKPAAEVINRPPYERLPCDPMQGFVAQCYDDDNALLVPWPTCLRETDYVLKLGGWEQQVWHSNARADFNRKHGMTPLLSQLVTSPDHTASGQSGTASGQTIEIQIGQVLLGSRYSIEKGGLGRELRGRDVVLPSGIRKRRRLAQG